MHAVDVFSYPAVGHVPDDVLRFCLGKVERPYVSHCHLSFIVASGSTSVVGTVFGVQIIFFVVNQILQAVVCNNLMARGLLQIL